MGLPASSYHRLVMQFLLAHGTVYTLFCTITTSTFVHLLLCCFSSAVILIFEGCTVCHEMKNSGMFLFCSSVNQGPVSNNCPSYQTIQANQGSTSATATWIEPTFTDELGQIITSTSNYNPGDSFPVGTTVVSYTATDSTGSQGTCTFNIIVVEGRCVTAMVQ